MGNVPIDIEDKNTLLPYLAKKGLAAEQDILSIKVLEGGVSNKTVLVNHKEGQSIVLKQALEKLRVKADWYSSPERIHREAAGLRWLIKIMPDNVPSFLVEDKDQHILGMSAIPTPHQNWKAILMQGVIDKRHFRAFSEILANIHNAVNKYPEIKIAFEDRSFFESLRLEPYYAFSANEVPEAKSFLINLIEATRKRQFALVHGDYSPKNVLIRQQHLYILDHEVVHFGDPAFDVGFALTHFISKAHVLEEHRSVMLQGALAFWEGYAQQVAGNLLDQQLEYYAVQHTIACMLARVVGRSPLEYLSDQQRSHQKALTLALIDMQPGSMSVLITAITTHFNQILEV